MKAQKLGLVLGMNMAVACMVMQGCKAVKPETDLPPPDTTTIEQPAQQPVKPSAAAGLERPEVPVGVIGDLFPVHHLPDTPHVMRAGDIQLSRYGPVHLAVVAHDHAGPIRKVLRSLHAIVRGEQPDEPSDRPICRGCFLIFPLPSDKGRARFIDPGRPCLRKRESRPCRRKTAGAVRSRTYYQMWVW